MKVRTVGIDVPSDFPAEPYDAVHSGLEKSRAGHPLFQHYAGAWNAVVYRFHGAIDYATAFATSLARHGAAPPPDERYNQEKLLFGFFSSSFSTLEATFYGLYAIGGMIAPESFPLTTERDQQSVTPSSTRKAYTAAFKDDPILSSFSAVFELPGYQSLRETRNVLTHRTAPGRRMYVSIGLDDSPPTEWKLNDAPLDQRIASTVRADLAKMLGDLIGATSSFVKRRF